jgi:hypothetical protein
MRIVHASSDVAAFCGTGSHRRLTVNPSFPLRSNEGEKLDTNFETHMQLLASVINESALNEEYETNAWVYSYIYEGKRYKMDGYFPQAGTNFLVGVNIRF